MRIGCPDHRPEERVLDVPSFSAAVELKQSRICPVHGCNNSAVGWLDNNWAEPEDHFYGQRVFPIETPGKEPKKVGKFMKTIDCD